VRTCSVETKFFFKTLVKLISFSKALRSQCWKQVPDLGWRENCIWTIWSIGQCDWSILFPRFWTDF